jgi:hypothetical protein
MSGVWRFRPVFCFGKYLKTLKKLDIVFTQWIGCDVPEGNRRTNDINENGLFTWPRKLTRNGSGQFRSSAQAHLQLQVLVDLVGTMLLCLMKAVKCKSEERLLESVMNSCFSDPRRSQKYNHTSSAWTVAGFVAWMHAHRCVRRLERSAIALPGAHLAYMRLVVQLRRVLLDDKR